MIWWLNLVSLGLYMVMVAVASLALRRGVQLDKRRIGRSFQNVPVSVMSNSFEYLILTLICVCAQSIVAC